MAGNVGNILNVTQQNQVIAAKKTARALDDVSENLASGKRVNKVTDNPQNYFSAQSLENRANDLQRLLDGIDQSLRTTEQVLNSIDKLQRILDLAESFLTEYRVDLVSGNVDLQETVGTDRFLDFSNQADFVNYAGGQDSGVPVSLIEDGFGVRLDDNAWRRYEVNYNVTANTTLDFEFRSSNIPEIAAIGFDNDTSFSNSNNQFFLYGTQTTGITYAVPTPTYEYDGSGDWVQVSIPVGTFFTGNFSHLTFITDDDGPGDDGDAQYRNMVIHEGDYVPGETTLEVSDTYEQAYSEILEQYDALIEDSDYRGVHLLDGEDLTTFFNEERDNTLVTDGIRAKSGDLGLEREDFTTVEAVDRKIDQVARARETLRRYAGSMSVDYGIISSRQKFVQSTINTLLAGRDDLTLSDPNKDAAELLALQTRQIIQVETMNINSVSIADFLT